MSCKLCTRGSGPCPSYNHHLNYGPPYYSDVPAAPEGFEDEPVAPTLSLGNRILWLTEAFAASGIVRWIGRIPTISADWTAGIEFDNVMPSGGNGDFQGRTFFNSRPGHSLFLPVTELIKVDDNTTAASGNSERMSFFGRLQDSCSNFAHRRRRDSTFGHFKQECYSSCAQNEFHCNAHYYSHAPVYDRITSRRSLHYDDHPYEMYNVHVPCEPLQSPSNQTGHNTRPNCSRHIRPHIQEDCLEVEQGERIHCARDEFDERIHRTGYSNDRFEEIHMAPKESIFNPRASLRLISGFKEWVSCLIMGTTRRKSKGKLVLKDRKSVTSVFLSNNSQSLTGQRLSSFSDYASVSVSRGPETTPGSLENRNLSESTNLVSQSKKRIINQKITGLSTKLESGNSMETSNQGSRSKKKSRKKRLAPLPPKQNSNVELCQGNRQIRDLNGVNSRIDHVIQDTQKDGRNNKFVTKTVKSTSIVSHSLPVKKTYKKRRAPPPPTLLGASNSSIYASVQKKERKNTQHSAIISNYDNLHFPSVRQKHNQIVLQNTRDRDHNLTHFKKHKRRPMHRQLQRMPNLSTFIHSNHMFTESGSDDSTSGSISFSADESGDEKYGLVKYRMAKSIDEESPITTSSNFVQYSGDNSDVCLKISIQKTETNVVTVEEVSPQRTVHYTIEEDTSSSELSDEPPVVPVKLKAIGPPPESKQAIDSSSISTEDNLENSKTIFEELQIKPPVKGSVKDFVHAFNMLATKSNGVGPQLPVESGPSNSKTTSTVKNPPKNIQSFPTKWEFQNSKGFLSNQFLLPIAEESVNETSEHDGNVSVEEDSVHVTQKISKNPSRDQQNPSYKPKIAQQYKEASEPVKNISVEENSTFGDKQKSKSHATEPCSVRKEVNENSKVKCSHCSEKHSPSSHKDSLSSKNLRKRIAPKIDKATIQSLQNKDQPSSQAHLAALSSLLQDNTMNEGKELSNNSSKLDTKSDQPIMVGLYIEDKASHRGPLPLLITPSMSLRKLKKQVEVEYDLPRHQQCWILGKSFAVRDEAPLASYGVKEAGCPILLYVMAKEPKAHSLPCRGSTQNRTSLIRNGSDTSDEEGDSPHEHGRSYRRTKRDTGLMLKTKMRDDSERTTSGKTGPRQNPKDSHKVKNKSDYHRAWEDEYEKKADYRSLLALDDVDLVANVELFECPVCFLEVESGKGAVLQDCLHSFCRECLAGSIQYSDTAIIKCPFANDEYSCESHLQEREIKCLVTPEVYERHLARSMALAESQAQDSFHCKTPDCPGWCLFEDNVNTFLCPVCKRTNCLTCAAVHEGRNCRQYQDSLAFHSDTSEEARKTREYLQEMVSNGEAMECPQCQVILMKKWGCDWLKCSMCHTEVCWVTKGPRWGPGGRGDTTGGCKCMLNGVRCHPKCSYCH